MFKEIDQFVNWTRRRNPDARTWRDYLSDLRLFVGVVGDLELHEITFREIDAFVEDQLDKQLRAATINRRLTAVMSLYTFMQVEDHQLRCPVIPHRHMLRSHQRLPTSPTVEHLNRFLAGVDSTRDWAMFMLMLRCGLRISEVAGMRLGDLYFNEVRPRLLVRGKNKKQRSVYLSGQTKRALNAYLDERPTTEEEAVFINCRMQPLTIVGIHKRIVLYRNKAGVHLTAHQLRHNFANDLVLADVPVTTIQKLMGHAWISTTQLYIAANDPKVREDFFKAVEKLEGWQ